MRVRLAAVATLALLVTACGGGGGDSEPRVIEAGQVDIKLPPGYTVERKNSANGSTGAPAPTASATPSSTLPGQSDATSPTTAKSSVPIKKSRGAVQDLIAASGKFRDCLNGLNVKFIGAPDASNPQSPTNDPDYIKSLSTSAARSNIVQVLQTASAEQDTWTPKQIKRQNEGYVLWRGLHGQARLEDRQAHAGREGTALRVQHEQQASRAATRQGLLQQQRPRSVLGAGPTRVQEEASRVSPRLTPPLGLQAVDFRRVTFQPGWRCTWLTATAQRRTSVLATPT